MSRPLYKRERAAARKKGILRDIPGPMGCLDATPKEVATAISALCQGADVKIGRTGEYCRTTDTYTLVGKDLRTGKAQDFKLAGELVAVLIQWARSYNLGMPLDSMMARLRQEVGGVT